ncbi:TolC family protein [Planctomycetes bacterium TBK1r]|uniref:Cobalt-zinc-cadmium resistance protein CzcC n=1 Tax=Stieleria magnilauensis TaxID=2527963 RepID=A0ABX5XTF0_9BACT|nr:Cobalt-zinc-cadmium resistance protein CzcC precursor [Planctomycetes bacterium TBK1r]
MTQPQRQPKTSQWMNLLVVMMVSAGCKSPLPCCDPTLVSREMSWRAGAGVETLPPGQEHIPESVDLQDGLSEDEAVATALTNNSAFQATLTQLGMAHGDAVGANLIANPQLLIYFPTGAKEGQYTLFAPIESYLLRPARVKVANREYRRIGDQLVQNGLDLARDVRVAYVDFALAHQQAELAGEALELRQGIEQLTEKRLENGEISELETIAARVDRLNAKASTGVQRQNVSIAEAALTRLIGVNDPPAPLIPLPLDAPSIVSVDEAELIGQALACRPDYQAARWSVAAASQRSRLSRWLFLRFDGVLDVRDGPGYTGTGAGLRADLPIFNRNQGGIIRADWEVHAALHTRDAIRDQIIADVRIARRQWNQAQQNLRILENEVQPALVDALEIAQKGFADGGTDYLLVLQTTTQYLDAKARILDQKAASARALAELERSVGCHLSAGVVDVDRLTSNTQIDGLGEEPISPVPPINRPESAGDLSPLGFASLLRDENLLESDNGASRRRDRD